MDTVTPKDLNELLAEKVMGWTHDDSWWKDKEGVAIFSFPHRQWDWSPSTSISDAELVHDEMWEQGYFTHSHQSTENLWRFYFTKQKGYQGEVPGEWWAPRPYAICRAALEAVK